MNFISDNVKNVPGKATRDFCCQTKVFVSAQSFIDKSSGFFYFSPQWISVLSQFKVSFSFFIHCNFVKVFLRKRDSIARPVNCFVSQLNFFHLWRNEYRPTKCCCVFQLFRKKHSIKLVQKI